MAGKHGEAGRGRLYVVATPIGNLGDISERAIATLGAVHIVFAEDTRHTRGLLAHHGIAAKLAALHEHNEREVSRELVRHLEEGRDVALVTDAGTPAISDPGAHAVGVARAAGFDIVPIPGPNAAIAALSVAGVPGPFAFVGFLPPKPSARRKALQSWRGFPHALVLYEAPHRILECVDDLARVLGPDRAVVLARELTKAFETVHACALGEARAWLEADPDRTRGEFVVIVSGAAAAPDDPRTAEGERVLGLLVEAMPVKTAVQLAAAITGGSRNELYAQALALKKPPSPPGGARRKGRKAGEG
jgi:16S rRNA (cytidine1402-2'-O)-methyltransferase